MVVLGDGVTVTVEPPENVPEIVTIPARSSQVVVLASGPKGDAGAPGAAGATGPTGPAGAGLVGYFDVKNYGAVGDGTTTDTTAINNAITAAVAANGILYFPPVATGYKTTSTIDIPGTIDVRMESPLLGVGITGPILRINNGGTDSYTQELVLAVQRSGADYGDWSNTARVGIVLNCMQQSRIYIRESLGNYTGLQMLGNNGGVVYNHLILGDLFDNKYAVDLNATGTGWVNENLFMAGKVQQQSALNLSQSRYGVRVRSSSGNPPNNNIFIKPSFEMHGDLLTGGAEAIPIILEQGRYNKWLYLRNESNGNYVARVTNTAQQNEILEGFSPQTRTLVDEAGDYPSTFHRQTAWDFINLTSQYVVFNETDLAARTVPYDGTKHNVPGVVLGDSSGATLLREVAINSLGSDYVELDGFTTLGLLVDTSLAKAFVFAADCKSGFGGRTLVRCYDAAGAVLDPASYTTNPLVKGQQAQPFNSTTAFGKGYRTGADTNDPNYFFLHADVKSIYVAVSGGSAAARVRGIRLSTSSTEACRVWTTFPENTLGNPVATQAPTTGTHRKGRRIFHGAAAVGSPQGWVCTTAGTPGTWTALPNL